MKSQITIDEWLKPVEVDIKGLLDDGYCPKCGSSLEDLVPICPHCKQSLIWERWKRFNADYLK